MWTIIPHWIFSFFFLKLKSSEEQLNCALNHWFKTKPRSGSQLTMGGRSPGGSGSGGGQRWGWGWVHRCPKGQPLPPPVPHGHPAPSRPRQAALWYPLKYWPELGLYWKAPEHSLSLSKPCGCNPADKPSSVNPISRSHKRPFQVHFDPLFASTFWRMKHQVE